MGGDIKYDPKKDPYIALLYWEARLKKEFDELNGLDLLVIASEVLGIKEDTKFLLYSSSDIVHDIFGGFMDDMRDPEYRDRVRTIIDMIKL